MGVVRPGEDVVVYIVGSEEAVVFWKLPGITELTVGVISEDAGVRPILAPFFFIVRL